MSFFLRILFIQIKIINSILIFFWAYYRYVPIRSFLDANRIKEKCSLQSQISATFMQVFHHRPIKASSALDSALCKIRTSSAFGLERQRKNLWAQWRDWAIPISRVKATERMK